MKPANKSVAYILAILSSFLLFAASPGSWSVSWIAWIGLIPLIIACHDKTPLNGAKIGFVCGLTYHLLLLYWIVIVLGRYGGLPLWLSIPALIGLAAYMGGYIAIFSACLAWASGKVNLVWFAPIAWVGLDYIRGWLFTGFPWQDLGYSQFEHINHIQFADLTGHFGITFILVLVNSLLVKLIFLKQKKTTSSAISFAANYVMPIMLICVISIYNYWQRQQIQLQISDSPTATIAVVQGNIDQSQKWQPALQKQAIDTYLSLSEKVKKNSKPDLIIWPETALPFFTDSNPLFNKITSSLDDSGPALLTGAPNFILPTDKHDIRYYNSAFLLSDSKEHKIALQQYSKQHLVPFGEYIPFNEYLPDSIRPLVESMGNFSAGAEAKPLHLKQLQLGILICYESIFPELARIRSKLGANLLVNLTNDAWYGKSSAPWQQLSMVVFRAIENRRSLARSANTGISCFINPLGQIFKASPLFETFQASHRLPLVSSSTFFTDYGHLFAKICLITLSLILLYGNIRSSQMGSKSFIDFKE